MHMSRRPFQPLEKFESLDKDTLNQIEELADKHPPKSPKWTEREDAILRKAYGRIDYRMIRRKLLPNRTEGALEHRALRLGLTAK